MYVNKAGPIQRLVRTECRTDLNRTQLSKLQRDILRVNAQTIRNYEQRGIIPPAMRNPINGWRVWDRAQLEEACERLQPRVPEAAHAA